MDCSLPGSSVHEISQARTLEWVATSYSRESSCNAGDPRLIPGLWRFVREGIGYSPTSVFLGFPCGSAGKECTCNVGDLGSVLRLGRSPGGGKGYPLQYSGLENSLDYIVHGVAKSWTWLSDFHKHTREDQSHLDRISRATLLTYVIVIHAINSCF